MPTPTPDTNPGAPGGNEPPAPQALRHPLLNGGPAGPVHLPSVAGAERDRVLDNLRVWVAALAERYAISPRALPPCWEKHPAMVEALLSLRDHERGSYAADADPRAAVDWIRAYQHIHDFLTATASLTQCSMTEHRQSSTFRNPNPEPRGAT